MIRPFRLRALAALMLITLLLCGCTGCAAKQTRYERVFLDVFDTVTTAILYDSDEESANARFDELHELLLEYHRLYDIYNAYDGLNNLYTVNENAGLAPVAVDERITGLVEYAKQMDTLTGGRLNVAMGSVLQLWSDYREAGLNDPDSAALPPAAALEAAGEHTNIESIVVDEIAGTVYISDAQTQLDAGAVGKGYAAEAIVAQMKQEGVTSMLLSIGGNVCSIGTRPDGTLWQVAVRDPYSDDNLCVLQVEGQSVVTSGSYERYYTVNGVRYHHIIDPATWMPSTYYDSVTVVCADSALADALTTGLFCMPPAEGEALVQSLDGVEALWVLTDGTTAQSDGFASYLAQ